MGLHLSEHRLHLCGPRCGVAGVDLVEGLHDLIGRRTGAHHVGSLRKETHSAPWKFCSHGPVLNLFQFNNTLYHLHF